MTSITEKIKNIDPNSRSGKAMLLLTAGGLGGGQAFQAKKYLKGKQAEASAKDDVIAAQKAAEAAKMKAKDDAEAARRASVSEAAGARGASGTLLTRQLGSATTKKKKLLGE